MCSLFYVFTLFYFILENMCQLIWEDFVLLVIFDTCDVCIIGPFLCCRSIVLDNLFDPSCEENNGRITTCPLNPESDKNVEEPAVLSDNAFLSTIVNQALLSLDGDSLEFTLTVPLTFISSVSSSSFFMAEQISLELLKFIIILF